MNGAVKIGTNVTAITNVIRNTQNVDLPSIPSGGTIIQTFTVTNASVGSVAYISPDQALASGVIVAYARVSAANKVEVRFGNGTLATIDPPAMNWHIVVIQ